MVRPAQSRIRESRIPLRAFAFARVNVMTDRSDKGITLARNSSQRAAQKPISLPVPVYVRRHERADSPVVRAANDGQESFFAQRLAKMHEESAAPRAICRSGHVHRLQAKALQLALQFRLKCLKIGRGRPVTRF